MNARDFFDKVSAMRAAQQEYFRTRSNTALTRSKALEREIDAEISRVKLILNNRPQYTQGNLFDSNE